MCENISAYIEKQFPERWTPNVITLIGGMSLPITAGIIMSRTGTKLTSAQPIEDNVLILAGLSLLWFSQFDIMDGVRARR